MLIPQAHAQTAGAPTPGPGGGLIGLVTPLLLVMVAFYFIMVRPQQRRQKEFKAKLDAIKKGDQVLTAGGIVGKVTKLEDQYLEVEIAPNIRVRVLKSTIGEVIAPASAKPAND